jgi:phospholipid/cholesterol/gamma-HCH transport system substrate-binding protein
MNAQRWFRFVRLVMFMGFGLGVAVYLLSRVGTTLLPSASAYTVEADVNSSIALTQAADVREAGVLIGRVTDIRRDGTITALKLSIDRQYAPIYKDGTILIRAKSIAGENYVQVDPGNPQSGRVADHGVISVNQELQPVQDDDVFSILSAPERANLQKALTGLGHGLQGQGGDNLNSSIESMTSLVDNGQAFARILDEERHQTAQLVSSFDGVASALGNRAQDIQTLTRTALATSQAVAARNADLRQTIAALPGFLSQAETTSNRLGNFSATATPVFKNLRVATESLVPAMEELKPAAQAADRTLATLQDFSTTALPTFKRLTPFAETTSALIGPYSKFLQQLSPLSKAINPYSREVGSWFSDAGAAVNASDSISHLARIILPISRSNFPTVVSGQVATILAKLSGGLDTRGQNPYPLPGAAAAPTPLVNLVPALQAAAAYHAKPPKPLKQRK